MLKDDAYFSCQTQLNKQRKQRDKNEENYLKILSLISSTILRKLRLRQKKWFSYKQNHVFNHL